MDVNGNDNTPEWGYCTAEGCHEPAIPCFLPNYDDKPEYEPDDLLCVEHCSPAGYCWGCGTFWAGCEDFDFDPRGLCSNCRYNPDLGYEPEYEDEGGVWFDPFEEDLTT